VISSRIQSDTLLSTSTSAYKQIMSAHTHEQVDGQILRAMQATLNAAANRGPEWLAAQLAAWSNLNSQRWYSVGPSWGQPLKAPAEWRANDRGPSSMVRVNAPVCVCVCVSLSLAPVCVCVYLFCLLDKSEKARYQHADHSPFARLSFCTCLNRPHLKTTHTEREKHTCAQTFEHTCLSKTAPTRASFYLYVWHVTESLAAP
jgi:hypothetical protein